MTRNERYLSDLHLLVLNAIRESPKDATEIREYLREHGFNVDRVDKYTRKLHARGLIIRKTSNHKYSNIWEAL